MRYLYKPGDDAEYIILHETELHYICIGYSNHHDLCFPSVLNIADILRWGFVEDDIEYCSWLDDRHLAKLA